MKYLIQAGLLWLLMLSMRGILPNAQLLPPLEAKRVELMEMRFALSLEALREPDDEKALAMLKHMAKEYISSMDALKPGYQKWHSELSAADKKVLRESSTQRKWLQLMQEIQFDEAITERFRARPELKRAYERIQFQCDRAADFKLHND